MKDAADQDNAGPRKKSDYVGAPAIFKLQAACTLILRAFDPTHECGIYQVGSTLERADWRDVDVRMIMSDEAFAALFPGMDPSTGFLDARWNLLSTMVSDHLAKATGLPIDFQFQQQSDANKRHKGARAALGRWVTSAGADP